MANEVKDELDAAAWQAATAAVNVGHFPERKLIAEQAIRAYLDLRPQREDAGAGGGVVGNGVAAPKIAEAAAIIEVASTMARRMGLTFVPNNDKIAAFIKQSSEEALAAPQPSAPEGWVLVPREPMDDLCRVNDAIMNLAKSGDDPSVMEDELGEATAIVIKAYRAALASPPTGRDATEEGWIEWNGSGYRVEADGLFTPVPRGHRLSVRLRSGEEFHNLPAGKSSDQIVDATGAFWRHDGSPNDIIAYRLAAPKPETAQKGGKS